jgi:hypothetical protein
MKNNKADCVKAATRYIHEFKKVRGKVLGTVRNYDAIERRLNKADADLLAAVGNINDSVAVWSPAENAVAIVKRTGNIVVFDGV